MRYISLKRARAEHVWQRPTWDCRACGDAWPCPPAKLSLTAGADRVSLAMYMWGNLDQAVTDLPRRTPAELFDRFVSWTTPRPAAPAPRTGRD